MSEQVQEVNFAIPPDWLTAREAARAVPGGEMTVSGMTNLLRLGRIRAYKCNRSGRWWVDPVSLAAYQPERGTQPRISAKLPLEHE